MLELGLQRPYSLSVDCNLLIVRNGRYEDTLYKDGS